MPVIGRDVVKRPRRLWIVVTTSLPITVSLADYKTFIYILRRTSFFPDTAERLLPENQAAGGAAMRLFVRFFPCCF